MVNSLENIDKSKVYVNRIEGLSDLLAEKQDVLIAGTDISISDNTISSTAIPSQTGNEGKFLMTNGTSVSWQTVSAGSSGNGIPVSIIEHRRKEISGSTVSLFWQDPKDTIIDGYVLSSWKSTTIVKKEGSYPESPSDGTVVVVNINRNQYFTTPYEDTQSNPSNWYYRAFPCSTNDVYSLDKRNCFGLVIYGFRISENDTNPASRVEYLQYCDNYFYDKCFMNFLTDKFEWGSWRNAFFIPRPCALLYNGTVDYYLSDTDFNYKEDGATASDVSNTSYGGNFMMEFPTIYTKKFQENGYINVLVSNEKVDDGFECFSCKKSDGTYNEHFYLPMFEGTNLNNVLRSIATNGKPTGSLNASNEELYATNNGSGWTVTQWADEDLMQVLFMLLFKSTDSQTALGYGATGSTSGLTCNNNAALTKGLMYGTASGSSYGMTFLGMHNWWAHRWRRCVGYMNKNGTWYVKMTRSTIDGSTSSDFNITADGYINTGISAPSADTSYIKVLTLAGENGKYGMLPTVVAGSSTTYYCDALWTNNGQLNQCLIGGCVYGGVAAGAFAVDAIDAPSVTPWNHGASPSYRPL